MSDKAWRILSYMTFCTSLGYFPFYLWFWRCSSCLMFPMPRTCTNCVRALGHINYLLMLTFEEDVSLFSLLQPGSAPCLHQRAVAVTTDRASQSERGESALLHLEILEKWWQSKANGFCAFLLCYRNAKTLCFICVALIPTRWSLLWSNAWTPLCCFFGNNCHPYCSSDLTWTEREAVTRTARREAEPRYRGIAASLFISLS